MVPRNLPTSSSSSSSSSIPHSPSSKTKNLSTRRKRAKTAHVTANEIEQENGIKDNQSLLPQDNHRQQSAKRSSRKNNSPARSSFTIPPEEKTPAATPAKNSVPKPANNRTRKALSSSAKPLTKEDTGKNNETKEGNSDNIALIGGSKESAKIIPGECCEEAENAENAESLSSKNPKKRKRKTKEEKDEEGMPLAARSAGLRFLIGAHVSAAKGVHNAVTNCLHIGGNAFALFLKSQRKWENPPMQDEHRVQFKALCAEQKYDSKSHILPHGSYLVNLAHEDPVKAKQSYDTFVDDLHRCEALGIGLYNFHPGAANSSERAPAIARIAAQLNASHAATSTVTTVLETMAGGGTAIGSTFDDLAAIIALIDNKSRIGVCIDTCHIFAAGYDLRSRAAFESTLARFEETIGLEYLKAVHLNDSKTPLGSRLDRHANIGVGFLGLGAFWNIMNDARFENLPIILETPAEDAAGKEDKGVYAREIKLLEKLVGMERDGEKFGALEAELAQRGEAERRIAMEKFEKKEMKVAKEREKAKGKGKDNERRLDQWISRKAAAGES